MCPGRTLSAASPARRERELSAAVMPPPRAGCAAAADALRRLRGAACISEHTRSHGAPSSRSSIANPSAYSRLFLLSCTIPRARTVQHKAHTAQFPIHTAIHWYWQFRSLLPTQSTCAAELKSAWSLCHSSACKHAKDVHATVLRDSHKIPKSCAEVCVFWNKPEWTVAGRPPALILECTRVDTHGRMCQAAGCPHTLFTSLVTRVGSARRENLLGAPGLHVIVALLELAAEGDEGGIGAQCWHGGLQQHHARAVHVEAVRVVQLPQDWRQRGRQRDRRRPRRLRAHRETVSVPRSTLLRHHIVDKQRSMTAKHLTSTRKLYFPQKVMMFW